MNINQMKTAIKKFRGANVAVIKDEALRAKAQTLQAKQKGFTLLELLIVITILATLATAALVAYDGIGENASDTAVANNLISAESAIRNYRAIENVYPNQWDNMADVAATALVDASGAGAANTTGQILAQETLDFFGQWQIDAADATLVAVGAALNAVGIDELQTIDAATPFIVGPTIIPNLVFNESNATTRASELEFEYDEVANSLDVAFDEVAITTGTDIGLAIVPAGGTGTCTAGSIAITTPFNTTLGPLTNSSALNLINDNFDDDQCTLVLALGYGKDVPGTTVGSRVGIAQVPTLGTTNVNPANHYARAIALFQVGVDDDEDGNIDATEIFAKARLMGVVDPEGRAIDTALHAANATN